MEVLKVSDDGVILAAAGSLTHSIERGMQQLCAASGSGAGDRETKIFRKRKHCKNKRKERKITKKKIKKK